MADTLSVNVRLRLAYLDTTWTQLCRRKGASGPTIRAIIRRGTPTQRSLERIAELLEVPPHSLLDPKFDPKDYPVNKDG